MHIGSSDSLTGKLVSTHTGAVTQATLDHYTVTVFIGTNFHAHNCK